MPGPTAATATRRAGRPRRTATTGVTRSRRRPSTRPATASAAQAGAANSAVASAIVSRLPTTITPARPTPGTAGPGRRTATSRSTSSPMPKHTATRAPAAPEAIHLRPTNHAQRYSRRRSDEHARATHRAPAGCRSARPRRCRSSSPASTRRRTSRSASSARWPRSRPAASRRGRRLRQQLDRRQRRARRAAGARVVHESRPGYGSAYLAGFAAARGEYIVMADADLTYDFAEIPRFVAELDKGAQLVMGDRMDNIHPGAMPWLHRYVGNPILTGILNVFFKTGVSDAHCGMRGFRRDILPILDLRTTGMEFASEMVIRASKEKLRIAEFPIEYHPRGGESKLSSFRDGWRHLRFLLVHSPTHLFMLPGRDADRARRADRADRDRADRRLRPRVGHPHDGRRRAADDRRHAGRRPRPLRARLRHVLHGREGPVVRPHARALPARARAGARRRADRSPGSCSPP